MHLKKNYNDKRKFNNEEEPKKNYFKDGNSFRSKNKNKKPIALFNFRKNKKL